MPRFFFDVDDGDVIYDVDGVELADLSAARAEMAGGLCQLAMSKIPVREAIRIQIDVLNDRRKTVATGTLMLAIEPALVLEH